jgi:hypothetical protein
MNSMLIERPLTREQLVERHREYNARIAPIVRHLVMLEAFRPPPRILLHPDGRMEIGEREPLPPECEKVWAQCQELIDAIRTSLFSRGCQNEIC